VALATPFLLGDKLGRGTLIGIGLAILGGVIITLAGDAGSAPRQDAPLLGAGLALLGAITVSGYVIIGRRLRPVVAFLPYIWLVYGTAAAVLIVVLLVTGTPVAGYSSDAYLHMTLVGLVPQLIGHSAYNYALGHLSAAFVSLNVLGEPVISTALAALPFVLNEQPKPLQLVGSALILLALIIASRDEARAASARSAD
jgi:drug/metabolite transporter (DMT)-like permease